MQNACLLPTYVAVYPAFVPHIAHYLWHAPSATTTEGPFKVLSIRKGNNATKSAKG